MKTAILKPGYLVSLKTSLRGGVSYARVDLEADHINGNGERVARWETKREIADPAEFDRATVTRGKCRSLVSGVCANSSFGLLCPIADEGRLSDAIAAARGTAEEFNAGSARSKVDVYVLVGRIAQDDAEAARAIGSEIRELLDAMREGIKAADPAAIREAANKARALGGMLSADVASQVSAAIVEARAAARELVKRVGKAGEAAADVVAQCYTQKIDAARFAFLDLDQNAASVESVAPAGRAVEFEPEAAGRPEGSPEAPVMRAAGPATLALEF